MSAPGSVKSENDVTDIIDFRRTFWDTSKTAEYISLYSSYKEQN